MGWRCSFPNWLLGLIIIPISLSYAARVEREEQMLVETFGEQYQQYMEKTGRLFPKFGKSSKIQKTI
jgi:protein-S-isoprenylcysteine O-methyltransferase Ste14